MLSLLYVFCSFYSDQVQMEPISVANFHAQLNNLQYGRDCARDTLQIIHLFPMWGEALLQQAIRSIMVVLHCNNYSITEAKQYYRSIFNQRGHYWHKTKSGSRTDEVERISLKQP